ncbi:carboxymuconolactone decarboxylase family protein [Glycomyces salinus]|uniref:carboxymuconolactone decarboxylase family protein n=1 Tax=Glycomyces salinus TaxID=980294 RepID=UPI0018ECEE30|nr:carboxymuconolactone decarboxylase family protein [Glycomyces salinus]
MGRPPINLHRALAHAPAVLGPLLDLIHAIRYEAAVPRSYVELVICRIARLEGSAYELAHHLPMAAAAGVSADQIERLDHWRDSDRFDPAERAVLNYAEHLGGVASRDDAELAAHFGPAEQTELTVAGSTYVAIARLLRALEVEIDPGL